MSPVDTLLIDMYGNNVQQYMNAVVELGKEYGMQINWKKVDVMQMRAEADICDPGGKVLVSKDSIKYLGALLHESGKIDSELSRRIGIASGDFKKLSAVWNHSSLSKQRKFQIYRACICSNVLYGLQTAWLTKSQRGRLDGFDARCLRKILGIKSAYWSRVSNHRVLVKLNAVTLSTLLLEQQLLLFRNLFDLPDEDIRRQMVFQAGSAELRGLVNKRRRGRPRLSWASELQKHVLQIVRDPELTARDLKDKKGWKEQVRAYTRK